MIRSLRYVAHVVLLRIALSAIVVFNFSAAGGGRVCAAEARPGKQWAVLIGCERYVKATPLKFTVNDVNVLADTLQTRGGYPADRVLVLSDQQAPERRPVRQNIMDSLMKFLKGVGPGDSVIVYFSGHGFKDPGSDRLYLAPLDVDPAAPQKTGVPVEWLRNELANCPAEFKLLVLDACHAGSEKGEDDASSADITEKDLASFVDVAGVATLASSTAGEKSQIWFEKQQSLFSYWLNQGLKGHADDNADGAIQFSELYEYLSDNVTYTAEMRFPRPQHPVRVVRSAIVGEPTVVELQPTTLREVLSDNAELLANYVEDRTHDRIGVLEFTNLAPGIGELLGANYGALGRWCTEEFERRLAKAGRGKFQLIDQRRMQGALKAEGFTIDDLGAQNGLERLSTRVGGMPVVAIGTFSGRRGRMVTVKCELLTLDGRSLGETIGTAQLNESEWAMLGRSARIEPSDRTPVLQTSAEAPAAQPEPEDVVVEHAEERSRTSHPLQDGDFEFPVQIRVAGKVRPLKFVAVGEGEDQRTECLVPFTKGEVFEVWVGNRSGEPVKMRLLVDGCNTMPEIDRGAKGVVTKMMGQRVNLDEAASWTLNPLKKPTLVDGVPTWAIRGFFEEIGAAGSLREFLVSDVEKSVAARQQFTDQIGIITAAFYEAVSPTGEATRGGSLGIDAGTRRDEATGLSDLQCGDLLSVVHIRYVDAAAN